MVETRGRKPNSFPRVPTTVSLSEEDYTNIDTIIELVPRGKYSLSKLSLTYSDIISIALKEHAERLTIKR